MAALMASGLDARRFTFFGFPPARGRARQSFLDDVVAATCTTILFEAPHRIERTLRELAERAPGRSASLHRELTKLHEETRSGTLAELAADVGTTRGEFTLIVAGPEPKPAGTVEEALAQARTLLAEGVAPSAAARQAASAVRVGRREVYQRAHSGRPPGRLTRRVNRPTSGPAIGGYGRRLKGTGGLAQN